MIGIKALKTKSSFVGSVPKPSEQLQGKGIPTPLPKASGTPLQ